MNAAITALTAAFDGAVRPLAGLPPIWLLSLVALVTAVPTLLVFARLSDQVRLRTTKNRIKAHVLELWLFRDDVGTVLRAQGRLLGLNARYLWLTLPAMAVIAPPMLLLLGALAPWYESRPLRPGETTIVSVHAGGATALGPDARLVAGDGLVVETPALRIPAAGEIDWRVRAVKPGVHTVSVEVGGQRLDKQIVAGTEPARVNSTRTTSGLWQALTAPGEAPLPGDAPIERIDVRYPAVDASVWGLPWWGFFFAAMIVFVFVLKRPLRVEM
jgi:hypothetical protein